MKPFNNRQTLIRVIAAVIEAILFYTAYLPINLIFGGGRISLIFFIVTSLCGLFVNYLPYNSLDQHKQRQVFGMIGLALGVIAAGIAAIQEFNLLAFPLGLIFIIYLYYRTNISYLASVSYVYTVKSFYQSTAILVMINLLLVIWHEFYSGVSAEMVRCSILYVILALYLLSEIKNFRYISKNENSHRTAFDIIATNGAVIFIVVMSIPQVFDWVTWPFAVVFKWIYGWIAKAILLVMQPFAMLMGYLHDLFGGPGEVSIKAPTGESALDINDKLKKAMETRSSPIVQLIGEALAFLVIVAICAFVIYLLFRFINKVTRKDEEDDFVEEKEFLTKRNVQKPTGMMNKLAGVIRKAAGGITFMMKADNKDKLRRDYKNFIEKLYGKKIISSYNYTAQDIFSILLPKVPDKMNELTCITEIYEEVRYGTRYPKDSELKSFRKNLEAISKNLLQLQ